MNTTSRFSIVMIGTILLLAGQAAWAETIVVSPNNPDFGSVAITNLSTGFNTNSVAMGFAIDSAANNGHVIRIRATPAAGYVFVKWTGDIPAGTEEANPVLFVQTAQNRQIVAQFALPTGYSLSLDIRPLDFENLDGVGTGAVIVSNLTDHTSLTFPYPGGAWSFPSGAVLRITAVPQTVVVGANSFTSFVYEWTGDVPETLAENPRPHPRFFQLVMDDNKEIALLFSREYHPQEGYGDLDLDGLPDTWELTYGLDAKDPASANGPNGNPANDLSLPVGWSHNRFASGDYPALIANLYTAWPYRFHVDGSRPINYYVGIAPFGNWLQCRGFDGWYGLNPLTGRNDDPGTDPNLLSTGGDGISDGWKYFFWGTAINDTNMIGTALGVFTDPNLPIPTTVISNIVIRNLLKPSVGLSVENDEDNDCHQLNKEFLTGTDPVHWDTDADLISDGYEAFFALNPIDGTDGDDNSSGDWMAFVDDAGTQTRHYQVYGALGFDPRTAWGQNYLGRGTTRGQKAQENTVAFDNREKFFASVYLAVLQGSTNGLTCTSFGDYALNPKDLDTDDDGIFDGWELYVGLNPKDPLDAGDDADSDKLSSFREFSCLDLDLLRGTPWPNGKSHFDPTWLNKVWPTDPNIADTDGDSIKDGGEGGYANLNDDDDGEGALTALKYSAGARDWTGSAYTGGGLNPTSVDTDNDRLPDHWEAKYRSAIYSMADLDDRNGMDPTLKDQDRDVDGDGLVSYQEYLVGGAYHWNYGVWAPGWGLYGYDPIAFFTGVPHEWDWHFLTTAGAQPYLFIPPENSRYATTSPRLVDSDGDMMDDFYEIYHGLNPIFGTYDLYASKVLGGTVLADFWTPVKDIRVNPYLAGSQYSDPDQDGLPNSEEALVANWPTPRYYHTDPSPLWVTDASYQLSWVNLYYWQGSVPWYWDDSVLKGTQLPPAYSFSFETDEGFDTDNDGLGDRAELVNTPESPGTTDPLRSDSPPRRRALLLNGNAAARTRGVFYHDATRLENFTIEAWVRPQNPASGSIQVILERPMFMPVGNIMGAPDELRLNFRLALDENGRPFVAYNGAGFDALYFEAKAPSTAALQADTWYHLAGVYDGAAKKLFMYVDGQLMKAESSAERPVNGWINGNPGWVHSAPMVLGARDKNPDGWVMGTAIWVGPYAGGAQTQPDLDLFFQGWVDEVRVWDGARSPAQIVETLYASLKQSAVTESIRAKAAGTTAAELMYLYTFDDMLDPIVEGIRPAGFDLLNGRPNDGSYPNIPWWGTANDRSMVYSDYLYLPWIENLAAHVPLDPPADSSFYVQLVTSKTSVVTYDTNGVVTASNTLVTVTTNSYPNTANPYNFAYYHGVDVTVENHPDYLNLLYLIFNPRKSSLFNDMLPLRFARADSSVDLWDGQGPGSAGVDGDEDGMSDAWELANGLDPENPADGALELSAVTDPDGDGIVNYWEAQMGLDPFSNDSDGDGVADGNEDSDGDNLTNLDEINTYLTNPARADTDDDTVRDDVEILNNTSALYSRSPLTGRSMVLNGVPVTIPEPRAMTAGVRGPQRFQELDRWVVAAMVRPDAGQTGSLVRRNVSNGAIHFELGLNANVPFIRFDTYNGHTHTASGTAALPTDEFSELIGEWNPSNHVLRLLVNDCVVGAVNVAEACIRGAGETVIGDGVNGRLDDLFIGRHLLGGQTQPPEYVLMMDVSGSMAAEDRMAQAKAAALTAISMMPKGSAMAIITFDHEVEKVQDFTTDREVLQGVINGLVPLGATSYSQPVSKMIELLRNRPLMGPRVGIFISDGEPNSGVPTDADLQEIVSLGALINAVGFGSTIVAGNTYELQRLALLTGGTFYPAPSGDELAEILSVIVSEEETDDACFYPFDDGATYAEDYTQLLDWDYALLGVTFDSVVYSTAVTPFNYAFVDTEDELPQWWLDWFLANSDETADTDDPDSDGLNNLNEWRVTFRNQALSLPALSPMRPDSNGNGTNDGNEDADGDTLVSRDEQDSHESRVDRQDTDDDGLNDRAEVADETDPSYSVSPYVMRALRFGSGGGLGEVLVEDRVRGQDTEHLDAAAWTLECFVQPEAVPPVGVNQPLISRALRCSGRLNYELGIRNDGAGNIVPYVRFNHDTDANLLDLSTGTALPLNGWTHLAGRLASNSLALFIDGQLVRSVNTAYDPAQGPGDLVMGANGFTGRLKDVRIWKIGRRDIDIQNFAERSLMFDARAADPGLLRVTGDRGHLREVAAPNTARDQLREWTLECWMRTSDKGGTIISRVNTANEVEETDDFNYFIGVDDTGRLVGKFAIRYLEAEVSSNGTTYTEVFNTSANTLVSALPVTDGAWHHVAYTRDTDNAVLYIDGELAAIQDGFLLPGGLSTTVSDEDIRILDGPVEIGRNLAGDLDEIRIWNRVLTPTEIREVMAENLFGNENGLVTYFSFDFQQGIYAEDRAVLRDPSVEYGTYIPNAQHVRTTDQAPIDNFYPLRVYAFTSLLGYYSADDGGSTLENLLYQNNWNYAGVLGGDVLFDALAAGNKPYEDDSDGDGLPDSWETLHGLNPGNDRDADGAWGDPDNDGLNNRAEYLAGTDPNNWDTDGDGFSDYDSRAGVGDRTWGELYTDRDNMDDAWESLYPSILSPLRYDAQEDPDGDGWSNYAEYMGKTDPTDTLSHPTPALNVKVDYRGTNALGPVIVQAFSRSSMDGPPDAVGVITNAGSIYPREASVTFTNGSLREGSLWLFSWLDRNGDGLWQLGEPCGLAEGQPHQVNWGSLNGVFIGLTDSLMGYGRFAWEALPDYNSYTVSVTRGGSQVMVRTVRNRTYIHEGDYQYAGWNGLAQGAHDWYVIKNDGSVHASGSFGMTYPASLATPTLLSPLGEVVFARNEARWRMDANSTQYRLQIRRTNSSTGELIYDAALLAPFNSLGEVTDFLPYYAGDSIYGRTQGFTNHVYFWRVQAINPRVSSSYSGWSSFQINLQQAALGASTISGEVFYFGKVLATNRPANMVVQAFDNAGFSGVPQAQVTLTNKLDLAYKVMGLRPGTYYLRAFIDQNSNKKLDSWESWGYVKDTTLRVIPSQPKGITVPGNAVAEHLIVHDVDTDNDLMPDAWEYLFFGSLFTAGPGTDTDSDGLTDLREYEATLLDTDPTRTDTDADGLSDYFEVTYSNWWLGQTADPTHFDPYDPVGNPTGTDLDPLAADTDGDGYTDYAEIYTHRTSPINPLDFPGARTSLARTDPNGDADGDGAANILEVVLGDNPFDGSDTPSVRDVVAIGQVVPGTVPGDRVSWRVLAGIQTNIQVRLDGTTNLLQGFSPVTGATKLVTPPTWSQGPWIWTNQGSAGKQWMYRLQWSVP